jgi:hypothetical protein
MNITGAVLYIIGGEDVARVERAMQREDPEAYRERGPYFQFHRGRYYLVHQGDCGSNVRALLERIDHALGGIEISATQEELQALACLLEADECYSCFLADRMLLVPKPSALASFVQWMQKRADGQSTGDALLHQALWEIGDHFSLACLGTLEEGFTRIATPFLLPDHDVVTLYYRKKGETVLVTDLGETLAWLRSQHADPHLPEPVLSWIAEICSSLGIEQDRGMLALHVAAPEELTGSLLRLAQGIVRIAGLQVLLREHGPQV